MSDTKKMTKAQAKKEVQKLLAQAEGLLEEAGKLMDEHQFTATFMERNYFPRGMVLKQYEEGYSEYVYPEADGMDWMVFYSGNARWLEGTWKSSSEWKDC